MATSQHEILLKDLKEADSRASAKKQPARSRPSTFYARYVQDWWLVELLAVLLGIIAIVALCALLRHYDGKTAPRADPIAGVNITLNTLVSILATIGRVALLLSVSECISESKWNWYRGKHRPLDDLDTFDKASRGAWGGLQLLWKINIR